MEKQIFLAPAIMSVLLVVFSSNVISYAHEERLYSIGDKDYWITVGSINEPVFVDDKSGAEAFILLADPSDPLNPESNGTVPVEGLDKFLKFEISAGDKKKIMSIKPAWNDPGHYESTFYPTIETTYNYKLIGMINNVTVALDYQCNENLLDPATNLNSTEQISDNVLLKSKTGGFGCPQSRQDVGFPEPFTSNQDLVNMIKEVIK